MKANVSATFQNYELITLLDGWHEHFAVLDFQRILFVYKKVMLLFFKDG